MKRVGCGGGSRLAGLPPGPRARPSSARGSTGQPVLLELVLDVAVRSNAAAVGAMLLYSKD